MAESKLSRGLAEAYRTDASIRMRRRAARTWILRPFEARSRCKPCACSGRLPGENRAGRAAADGRFRALCQPKFVCARDEDICQHTNANSHTHEQTHEHCVCVSKAKQTGRQRHARKFVCASWRRRASFGMQSCTQRVAAAQAAKTQAHQQY